MEIVFHKKFKKQFFKLSTKTQKQFSEKLAIFMNDPFDFSLNNHALKGEYANCRSLNVSGDIRAISYEEKSAVYFLISGSHSELY